MIVATIGANAADPKRVLLLHSFGRDFVPWSESSRTFRAEFIKQSPELIDFYEASILEEEAWLIEYIRALFSGRRLDLIVTLGPPAARFVQNHRQRLFADTPMLITALAEQAIPAATLTANDTVVGVRLDLTAFVENILHLLPDTTNIVVIIGNSPIERFWVPVLRRAFQPFTHRVKFTWLNDLSLDRMVQQVAGLKPRTAIFYTIFAVDAAGVPHALGRAFAPIRAAANAPIFGISDYLLGQGIVGGPLIQHHLSGQRAASVAVRILQGETPGDIKIPPLDYGAPVYDWRELQRWGISEARLPPGSEIRFRPLSMWEQYRWQMVTAAAIVLAQGLMILGLLIERRRRRLAEAESRRHLLEVMHLNRIAAAGEMSASIAHEINQPLAAIVSSANAGLRWLSNRTPDLEKVAAALKRIVSDGHRASQVVETVRAMFKKGTQKSTLLDINDLIRKVLELSRTELKEHRISVRGVLTEGLPPVSVDPIQLQQVIVNLVRNAIEAMSSITDRARILRVSSEAEPHEVIIAIEDTGPGIDPTDMDRIFESFFTTKSKGMGMGLSICRSIVDAHGGRLSAAPAHPHGTVFRVFLPVPDAPR